MRHSLRRGAAACVAVLALIGFAGCGDKTSAADAATPPATASPRATTATPTATASPRATTASFPFKVGAVDAKDLASRMAKAQQGLKTYHSDGTVEMSIEGTAMTMTFLGDTDQSDAKSPKSHITMRVDGKAVEMAVIGSKVWVESGGEWVAADASQTAQLDQTTSMMQWARAASSAQYKGKDATGHHFAMTLDPSKLAPSADPSAAASLGALPVDYWTDDHMVPVKVSMEVSQGHSRTNTVRTVMTMSRFNVPVTMPEVG